MTDLELKHKLAAELPDLLEANVKYDNEGYDSIWFQWKDTGEEVTEREWDWIVRQVIQLLTPKQFSAFVKLMLTEGSSKARNAQMITWQQRAEASFKAKEQTK